MIDETLLINALTGKIFSAEVHNDDFDGTVIENLLCLGDVTEEVMKQLEEQPKFGEWIPCDQLPKESGDYLVWYDCGDGEEGCMVMNFDAGIGDFGYWCDEYDRDTLGFLDSEFIYFETAVAWMPLPTAYKE